MILRKSVNILRSRPCTMSTQYNSRQLSLSATCLQNVTRIPRLMEFPNLVSPKLSHSLRNKFMEKTLIAPYFDHDFSLKEFNAGARHAVATVANCLAQGDLDSLEHLLTPEALKPLRKNLR